MVRRCGQIVSFLWILCQVEQLRCFIVMEYKFPISLADGECTLNGMMNDGFTVADAYCGGILNWAERAEYDLSQHPSIEAYYDRFCARDSVRAARDAEG